MAVFRYSAIGQSGDTETGVIEADDRRAALRELSDRGLHPSQLETTTRKPRNGSVASAPSAPTAMSRETHAVPGRVPRKQITAFTREMASLLRATIPIPAALEGLGNQEQHPASFLVLGVFWPPKALIQQSLI